MDEVSEQMISFLKQRVQEVKEQQKNLSRAEKKVEMELWKIGGCFCFYKLKRRKCHRCKQPLNTSRIFVSEIL